MNEGRSKWWRWAKEGVVEEGTTRAQEHVRELPVLHVPNLGDHADAADAPLFGPKTALPGCSSGHGPRFVFGEAHLPLTTLCCSWTSAT